MACKGIAPLDPLTFCPSYQSLVAKKYAGDSPATPKTMEEKMKRDKIIKIKLTAEEKNILEHRRAYEENKRQAKLDMSHYLRGVIFTDEKTLEKINDTKALVTDLSVYIRRSHGMLNQIRRAPWAMNAEEKRRLMQLVTDVEQLDNLVLNIIMDKIKGGA